MSLPLPVTYAPMEANTAREIPEGPEWEYEPKWDGFRTLAFRDNQQIDLMSKAGQPLARYFPELAAALLGLDAKKFVLDGEIIVTEKRTLNFDALLQRIHPAESRIRKLAAETPATLVVFDLLVDHHDRASRLYRRRARRPQPLEHRTEYRVEAAGPKTGRGSAIRSFFRPSFPARNKASALASG